MGNTTIKNNTRHLRVPVQPAVLTGESRKRSVGPFGLLQATFAGGVDAWNTFRDCENTFDFKSVSELGSCTSHCQPNSVHCGQFLSTCFNLHFVLVSLLFCSSSLNLARLGFKGVGNYIVLYFKEPGGKK